MEAEIPEAQLEPLKQTFKPGSTRLLSIKVDNFRSYEHAEIGPFADLTMVIGPNGAGKSNMVQAVLWATGASVDNNVERRGQGKEKREVKVSLVFAKKIESGEVEETEFTRAMNVSGRNQYMMNQTLTTKKLYLASLAKLGICGNKAISCVVQQMTVEKLALLTGKSLTTLIEEISGSIHHKNAYDELSLKVVLLEEKYQTAKRKNVFACERLRESSVIVRQLQDQLEESQEYGRTLADLKQALVYMQLWKLDAEMSGHLAAKGSIHEKLAEVSSKEMELLHLKQQQLLDSQDENSERQQNLETIMTEISTQDAVIHLKKRQLIERTLELKNWERVATKYQKLVQRDEEKIQQLNEILLKRDSERQQKKLKLQKLQQTIDASTIEEICPDEVFHEFWQLKMNSESELQDQLLQVSELEHNRKELENKRCLTSLQKEAKQKQVETKMSGIDRILRDQRTIESDILDLQEDEKNLTAGIEVLKDCQSTIFDLEEHIKRLIKGIEVSDERRRVKRQLNAVFLALKQKFGDSIHGMVADMWEPTAEKYRTAALTLLSDWQNCIVVDKADTLLSCLSFIRKDFAGVPVKFIPLDQFPTYTAEELNRPSTSSGACLLLDRLVVDSKMRGIFHHFLENTVICGNKQEAIECAWKYTGGRRNAFDLHSGLLFTVRGTIIAPPKLLVEGSVQTSDNQKRAELKELQRQLDAAFAELREKDKKTSKIADNQQALLLDMQLELKQLDKKRLDRSLKEAQSDLQAARHELEKLDEEERSCVLEIRSVAAGVQRHRNVIKTNELRTFQEFRQAHGEPILLKLQEKISSSSALSLDAPNKKEVQELRGAIDKLEQETTKARADLITAEASREQWQEVSSKTTEEITRVQLDCETLKLHLLEQEQKASVLKKTKSELENVSKQSGKSRVQKQLQTLKQTRQSLDTSSKAESEQFVRKRQMKTDILRKCLEEGILVRVKFDDGEESYDKELQPEDLNRDDIVVHYTEAAVTTSFRESQTQWDEIISSVETEIKSKQNSSGNRLEESLEMAQEKHDHLQDEAKTSSEAFQNAIKELAQASREFKSVALQRETRFRSCYGKLQSLIGRIYKSLYAGQAADAALCAINEEAPFLDAVDYSCLVPGKQICKMEQLSGGEKTIAALTLLFAVINYQSPAFLILDEVDAALDQNKLSLLHDFLKNGASDSSDVSLPSPCIVVTHQRNMMYSAQALIGMSRVPGDVRSTMPVSLNLEVYKKEE